MQTTNLTIKKDYLTINLVHPDDENRVVSLQFEYDDKNLLSFKQKMESSVKSIEEIDKKMLKAETDEEYINSLDEALEKFYDNIFCVGTYEKVKSIQKSVANRRSLVSDLVFTITSMLNNLKREQEESEAEFYAADQE